MIILLLNLFKNKVSVSRKNVLTLLSSIMIIVLLSLSFINILCSIGLDSCYKILLLITEDLKQLEYIASIILFTFLTSSSLLILLHSVYLYILVLLLVYREKISKEKVLNLIHKLLLLLIGLCVSVNIYNSLDFIELKESLYDLSTLVSKSNSRHKLFIFIFLLIIWVINLVIDIIYNNLGILLMLLCSLYTIKLLLYNIRITGYNKVTKISLIKVLLISLFFIILPMNCSSLLIKYLNFNVSILNLNVFIISLYGPIMYLFNLLIQICKLLIKLFSRKQANSTTIIIYKIKFNLYNDSVIKRTTYPGLLIRLIIVNTSYFYNYLLLPGIICIIILLILLVITESISYKNKIIATSCVFYIISNNTCYYYELMNDIIDWFINLFIDFTKYTHLFGESTQYFNNTGTNNNNNNNNNTNNTNNSNINSSNSNVSASVNSTSSGPQNVAVSAPPQLPSAARIHLLPGPDRLSSSFDSYNEEHRFTPARQRPIYTGYTPSIDRLATNSFRIDGFSSRPMVNFPSNNYTGYLPHFQPSNMVNSWNPPMYSNIGNHGGGWIHGNLSNNLSNPTTLTNPNTYENINRYNPSNNLPNATNLVNPSVYNNINRYNASYNIESTGNNGVNTIGETNTQRPSLNVPTYSTVLSNNTNNNINIPVPAISSNVINNPLETTYNSIPVSSGTSNVVSNTLETTYNNIPVSSGTSNVVSNIDEIRRSSLPLVGASVDNPISLSSSASSSSYSSYECPVGNQDEIRSEHPNPTSDSRVRRESFNSLYDVSDKCNSPLVRPDSPGSINREPHLAIENSPRDEGIAGPPVNTESSNLFDTDPSIANAVRILESFFYNDSDSISVGSQSEPITRQRDSDRISVGPQNEPTTIERDSYRTTMGGEPIPAIIQLLLDKGDEIARNESTTRQRDSDKISTEKEPVTRKRKLDKEALDSLDERLSKLRKQEPFVPRKP